MYNQKKQLLEMWHDQYPEALAYKNIQSFEDYLISLKSPQHILVIGEDGDVKGWLTKMIREKKDWIALILDKSIQHQGYGSQLLDRVKSESDEINAWVVDHDNYKKADGNIYQSPLNFYIKNGFMVIPEERLEQSKITAVKSTWQKK
jgi:GNAT superfamily N-acetyltransferase